MTDALTALVTKWRTEAAADQRVSFCADELEAALRVVAPQQEQEDELHDAMVAYRQETARLKLIGFNQYGEPLELDAAAVDPPPDTAPQQEPPTNSAAPADREPFVDSPLKAAIRKAFDYPTVANIEAVARAAAVDPPPDGTAR